MCSSDLAWVAGGDAYWQALRSFMQGVGAYDDAQQPARDQTQ